MAEASIGWRRCAAMKGRRCNSIRSVHQTPAKVSPWSMEPYLLADFTFLSKSMRENGKCHPQPGKRRTPNKTTQFLLLQTFFFLSWKHQKLRVSRSKKKVAQFLPLWNPEGVPSEKVKDGSKCECVHRDYTLRMTRNESGWKTRAMNLFFPKAAASSQQTFL